MTDKILALFPGQGSQKVGMGLDLFNAAARAQELFRIADEVLGMPLSKTCFEGPFETLTLTEVTQPAILTVSVICFELYAAKNPGLSIAAAAGHSLGEYSALVAAGALRFEDAVLLVHKRGKYMQEAVAPGRGKMAAILGKDEAEIQAALQKVTSGVVQIANINAPGQIVIAGDKTAVEEAVSLLAPVKNIDLPVSAPFHCSLMRPAQERLAQELEKVQIKRCKFPVYANVSAQAVIEPHQVRSALEAQVCGQVRWVACMQNAIRDTSPQSAIEFGAGSALSGMLKRIDSSLKRSNVDSAASLG